MNFNQDKPIYLQMAERLMDEIMAGTYKDEERIPSVREYAVSLGVNTNTAMKAFDELSRTNIIYNKRGLGYFVCPGACENIRKERCEEFFNTTLKKLAKQMKMLGLSLEDIANEINKQL